MEWAGHFLSLQLCTCTAFVALCLIIHCAAVWITLALHQLLQTPLLPHAHWSRASLAPNLASGFTGIEHTHPQTRAGHYCNPLLCSRQKWLRRETLTPQQGGCDSQYLGTLQESNYPSAARHPAQCWGLGSEGKQQHPPASHLSLQAGPVELHEHSSAPWVQLCSMSTALLQEHSSAPALGQLSWDQLWQQLCSARDFCQPGAGDWLCRALLLPCKPTHPTPLGDGLISAVQKAEARAGPAGLWRWTAF